MLAFTADENKDCQRYVSSELLKLRVPVTYNKKGAETLHIVNVSLKVINHSSCSTVLYNALWSHLHYKFLNADL